MVDVAPALYTPPPPQSRVLTPTPASPAVHSVPLPSNEDAESHWQPQVYTLDAANLARLDVPDEDTENLQYRDGIPRTDGSTDAADSASDSGRTDLTSAPSMYSYASSRDGLYMKVDMHGRMVNGQTELYALPADEEEHARLDTQHVMLQVALGGHVYPDPERIKAALTPTTERTRQILDVGSGAGVWSIQMAYEYPHAQVKGVDLVLPAADRPRPDNCQFEADDVTLGMSHYHSCFDVVHARNVSHGVPDYETFIDDIADTLRPGGVLIVCDGMLQLFREDKSLMDSSESSFQKVLFHGYCALKDRGSGVDTTLTLRTLMEKNPKLKNVGYVELFIPIGTWYNGDGTLENRRRWHEMGELLRHDCHGFADALRPLLLSEGYKQEWVDEWISEAHQELNESRIRGWAVWVYVWGDREEYDVAPQNPPPSPRDRGTTDAELTGESQSVDDLVSTMGDTTLSEAAAAQEVIEEKKAKGDLVKLWLEDATDEDEHHEASALGSGGRHEEEHEDRQPSAVGKPIAGSGLPEAGMVEDDTPIFAYSV